MLGHLKEKYSFFKIRNSVEIATKFKSYESKDLMEQSDWFGEFANQILTYINDADTVLTSAERLSPILMMILNADKMAKILSFVSNYQSSSTKKISTVFGNIQGSDDAALLENKKAFDEKFHGKKTYDKPKNIKFEVLPL